MVTGSGGQLGSCFRSIASNYTDIKFYFYDSKQLNITNKEDILLQFRRQQFDYCINCAAYTKVDQAEKEPEKAYAVNATGPKILAEACRTQGATLIHISTDFVFGGNQDRPYNEEDRPNPLGVYGSTKLKGEEAIASTLKHHIIIRTSWVYSPYGHNFVKTMLRLAKESPTVSVVCDQLGSPTYAMDLAYGILQIVRSGSNHYGIYHFSNKGVTSWYEFASKVFQIKEIAVDLKPIKTKEYKTLAKRPLFSVLDTSKIELEFKLKIKSWDESLESALKEIC